MRDAFGMKIQRIVKLFPGAHNREIWGAIRETNPTFREADDAFRETARLARTRPAIDIVPERLAPKIHLEQNRRRLRSVSSQGCESWSVDVKTTTTVDFH